VQRQYSGTAGRIQNCQNGVFLGYTTRHGSVLIDRALYLPQSWTSDRERCHEVGVPDDVPFLTKPKIGKELLARAVAAGVPASWVTADSVYGADSGLRRWLEKRKLGYVLAVTGQQPVWFDFTSYRIDEYVAERPQNEWQRLSAGNGSKGPRLYDWIFKPLAQGEDGWLRAMLARRSISKPDEIAYYLVHMPAEMTVEGIVRIAGSRWTIESLFEATKNEVGLDQYEVRSWHGWHRHMTLAMFTYAYLAAVRKDANGEKKLRGQAMRRDAPAYRTGSTPLDLETCLEVRPRSPYRLELVGLASRPPISRQACALAGTFIASY
jgi:SRSO17 transposase